MKVMLIGGTRDDLMIDVPPDTVVWNIRKASRREPIGILFNDDAAMIPTGFFKEKIESYRIHRCHDRRLGIHWAFGVLSDREFTDPELEQLAKRTHPRGLT